MDETVHCIVEEGFAAASAKHIAERAGVTWGVIQYHFGDRDGLFAAVVDDGFADLRSRMAAVDVPTGPRAEAIATLVDTAWAAFSTPTSRASLEILIATRAQRDRATRDHLAGMAEELTRLGRELDGAPPHGDRSDSAVGELVWATLRGLVLTQMVTGWSVRPSRELSALVDALTARFGPDPEDPPVPDDRPGRPSP